MGTTSEKHAAFRKDVVNVLKRGGIAVIPTDTLYGVVACATDEKAVQKLYELKGRDDKKPFIILISGLFDLQKFGITLDKNAGQFLAKNWPAPLSVLLPCSDQKFSYLHRGTKEIAFRMPASKELRELISSVGPLAAPSANPQGKEPARTIEEAKSYFGDKVDARIDGGVLKGEPSTLIRLENGRVVVVREGSWKEK